MAKVTIPSTGPKISCDIDQLPPAARVNDALDDFAIFDGQ